MGPKRANFFQRDEVIEFIEKMRLDIQENFGELLRDTQWLDSDTHRRRIGLLLRRRLEVSPAIGDNIRERLNVVMRELRLQNEEVERRFFRIREILRQHDLTTNEAENADFLNQFNTSDEILRHLNTTEALHRGGRIGEHGLIGFGVATAVGGIEGLLESVAGGEAVAGLLPFTAPQVFFIICFLAAAGIALNELYFRPRTINIITQEITQELGRRTPQEWREIIQLNVAMRRGLEVILTEEIAQRTPGEDRERIALITDARRRNNEGRQANTEAAEGYSQPPIFRAS